MERFFFCPPSWIQIAAAICREFVHIQSFASYRLRLRSLPLTLRYMDKFSQLLPQLTFIKRNACYACFSPTDRRSSGPPACATHTFRPFPTASQADAFTLALLHRAQPTERDLCLPFIFSFEKNGGSTAFYHTFHSTNKGKYTTDGSSLSWSICKPLLLTPGVIHLFCQKKK